MSSLNKLLKKIHQTDKVMPSYSILSQENSDSRKDAVFETSLASREVSSMKIKYLVSV